jgi:hypothetical protein
LPQKRRTTERASTFSRTELLANHAISVGLKKVRFTKKSSMRVLYHACSDRSSFYELSGRQTILTQQVEHYNFVVKIFDNKFEVPLKGRVAGLNATGYLNLVRAYLVSSLFPEQWYGTAYLYY